MGKVSSRVYPADTVACLVDRRGERRKTDLPRRNRNDAGVVHVGTTKSARGRLVPVPRFVLAVLLDQIAGRKQGDLVSPALTASTCVA